MNKNDLLQELDDYLVIREPAVFLDEKTLSSNFTIRFYRVNGVLIRKNNRVERTILHFYVYREGEAQEAAYYEGRYEAEGHKGREDTKHH